MKLSDIQKGKITLALENKNLTEVGLEFGFDKHYSKITNLKAAVYRAYQAVCKDPTKYGVSPEQLEAVRVAMNARTKIVQRQATSEISLREKVEEEESLGLKELVLNARNKSIRLLSKKLDRVGRTNKTIDEINLGTLATVTGILFDKGQIVSGEATENVALLARVQTENLSPEEALSTILQMRDVTMAEKEAAKEKRKKK